MNGGDYGLIGILSTRIDVYCKGTRKPNLGGKRAGRQHTRQETQNLGLKAITDKSGPVSIRFEFGDRETLMPLGEHAAHWANYLGELVRELLLHYPSWRHGSDWGKPSLTCVPTWNPIASHLSMRPSRSIYKRSTMARRLLLRKGIGFLTRRLSRPSHISEVNWDAQIAFWNDPKNRARATQNKQNQAKSKV
ncbi:hypothetical protein Tco_0050487, partial [Tanacetum coccineum]